MRTTIELTTDQRAQLLELAAQRGEKGFSRIIREALDAYLETAAGLSVRVREAQSVLGTLDDAGAESLRTASTAIRDSWR